MVNNDVSAGMATINSLNRDGLDLRQFNRELVEYLRGLLLVKTGSDDAVDLTAEDLAELKDLAAKASLPQILRAVKLFGQLEFGFDNYSTLPLELALVDCVLSSGEEPKESTISQTEDEIRQPPKAVTPPPPQQPIAKPEPASVSQPPPVESMPATPLDSEIERLRLNWRRVIDEAPADIKRTNAIALLRSAGVKPVTIEDDTVVLAFRYSIHKENMEKPENQQVAEKIISTFLGRPCRVRCVYEPQNNHLVKAALRMGAQVTSVEEK